MRKLLVLQHVAREPLGILDPLLREAGLRIRYVNFAREPAAQVDIGRYAGLIVLGGPMNVDEADRYPHLTHEIEILRAAVDRKVPTLGICLGAQLLAAALGARVHPNPVREIGWYPLALSAAAADDPLFRHLEGAPLVFQWHAYTFTEPRDSVHLASTASCGNQAFRHGDFAYGLQFHLEVDRPLIQAWLTHSECEPAIAEEVERQTVTHLERSQAQATRLFDGFIRRLGARRTLRLLTSR
jgi:GMP synthase (glutamine-hydrolysing)